MYWILPQVVHGREKGNVSHIWSEGRLSVAPSEVMSSADLQLLRNAMKKDPKAYTDELALQVSVGLPGGRCSFLEGLRKLRVCRT